MSLRKFLVNIFGQICAHKWPTKIYHADTPLPIDRSKMSVIPNYFRLYICINGYNEVMIPTENGLKKIILQSGEMIVAYPNCWIFTLSNKNNTSFRNIGLHFCDQGISIAQNSNKSWPEVSFEYYCELSEFEQTIFDGAIKLLTKSEVSKSDYYSKIQAELIYFMLYDLLSKGSEVSSVKTSLQEMKYYIDLNLNQNLKRETLASLYNVNKAAVTRFFKEKFDTTFRAYLLSRRMEYASELLVNTSLEIGKIGAALNYSCSESLCNAFENYFKMSPTAFRRAAKNRHLGTIEFLTAAMLSDIAVIDNTGYLLVVPFVNMSKYSLEIFKSESTGVIKSVGIVAPESMTQLKVMGNSLLLVKHQDTLLGGYQLLERSAMIVFGDEKR